jgi:hypothetical protein
MHRTLSVEPQPNAPRSDSRGVFLGPRSDPRIGQRRQRRGCACRCAMQPDTTLTDVVQQRHGRSLHRDDDTPTRHHRLRVQAPRLRAAQRTVGPDHGLHRACVQRRRGPATALRGVFEQLRPHALQTDGQGLLGRVRHRGLRWIRRRGQSDRATRQTATGQQGGHRQQGRPHEKQRSHARHCGVVRHAATTPRNARSDAASPHMRHFTGANARSQREKRFAHCVSRSTIRAAGCL